MLKTWKSKIVSVLFTIIMVSGLSAAEVDSKTNNAASENSKSNQNAQAQFVQNLQNILETGDLNKAIEAFDTLSGKDAEDEELLLIKSSLLISAGKLNAASDILSKLEEKDPSNIDVLEMKIIALKAGGAKSQSAKRAAISKVIALDPGNVTANIELGQENVLAHKYKNARNYFQKALKRAPTDSSALFGFGQTSYYLGEMDDAKLSFKKMLAINPSEAIAYQYLGKLEAEDENYKRAVEYVNKAIQCDAENYDFYMDLGTYMRFLGKFQEAEKSWTKAIELYPENFLAYAYRAGLYDEQNKFELALKDYRKVVETNPKYYFAYESQGILAWHESQWDEARKAFETAYSYNKTNVSYPLMIAACYIKQNKLQQAKLFLEQAMKSVEDKQSLEFMMLRLYHDQGPRNAENDIALKIQKEEKSNTKGKMLYYFALFYEMRGTQQLATKYYSEVTNMQSPMFFEYRLAEWGIGK